MISLMNHINSDRDNPLFALAFSSEGELYGYLETKTLDVLLMDENIPLDESKVPVACRMIFMTRDRVDGSEEISHNRIFKYSRTWTAYQSQQSPVRRGSDRCSPSCPAVPRPSHHP